MATRKKIRVAINGFGRIGRAAFKIALTKRNIEIVALNDLTDATTLAHLVKHDTLYGTFYKDVSASKHAISVGGIKYPIFAQKEPAKLPWKRLQVDVVLECTGRFRDAKTAGAHLKAGAKRVIISSPGKGEGISTCLLGVNPGEHKHAIVSNASCTTNSVAPVAQIIQEKFGIKKALMTTIHSYTASQNIQDGPHKDLRRARAAAQNLIPTTSGAALSTTVVLPELKGKFDGIAIRVPIAIVSLTDFTFVVKKKTTVNDINRALTNASKSNRYKGILGVTNEPLVSSDFIGDPRSSIVDLSLTKVVARDMVKIVAWYDNEWGYSNRLVDMVQLIS